MNRYSNIIFEIGTEEQSGTTNSPYELEDTLEKIYSFCDKEYKKKIREYIHLENFLNLLYLQMI